MQKKDQMHPEDLRNLIVFALIAMIMWLAYDHFVVQPQEEQIKAARKAAQQEAIQSQKGTEMETLKVRPRAEVIAEGKRIPIDSELIFGSINLKGARLDDLGLKGYYETLDKKQNINILSPTGTEFPKYIEHGWVASEKNLKLPDSKSVWELTGGQTLSSDNSVSLQWNNGQGLVFEQVISLNKDYGFTVIERVINNTDKPVKIYPYALITRRGIPKEFSGRWVVHEGPIGFFADELVEEDFGSMGGDPSITKISENGWIGMGTNNWLTAIVPEQKPELKFRMTYTRSALDRGKDRYQTDVMGPEMTAEPGGMIEYKTNLFAGIKKLNLLEKYEEEWNATNLDQAIDFGLYYFLTRPFYEIIHFFYGLVGNFGIAIIMFTVVLRIFVFPLANMSYKSFAKMKMIGPQVNELRDQHVDDKQALQENLVKLYQKEKVNPMAGCLPILVQIPIFFSLFKVLSNSAEMRHAPFFGWIQDLSAPDPTSVFNLFGLLSWSPPQMLMIGIWPCLMLITSIIHQKLTPPPPDKMQARIIAALPWFMTYILAQFASGLVIYWTINNTLAIIQQYVIMRSMGVEVDIIGNFLGKYKDKEKEETEKKESGEKEETKEEIKKEEKPKNISPPKPKKSKKKK